MPGANCAFPQCGTCRRHNLSIFKIPNREGEFYEEWRTNILNILTKYRVQDHKMKEKIKAGTIYICERHFKESDIELTKTGRKTLKLQAIPTENLPSLSHPKLYVTERRKLNIVKDITEKSSSSIYKSLFELHTRALKLKLSGWTVNEADNNVLFICSDPLFHVPKYEIIVDDGLGFTVLVYGFSLPDDHFIYKKYKRFMGNVTVSNLIYEIQHFFICDGCIVSSENLISHIVPCKTDLQKLDTSPINFKQYNRSKLCEVLIQNIKGKCDSCNKFEEKSKLISSKQPKNLNIPAKLKAPVSKTHPQRLKLAMQNERLKCTLLEKELARMKNEIKTKAVNLPTDVSDFINETMNTNHKVTPFMKLFWEQQKSAFSKKSVAKYHPMIIRFCLSLATKSGSAYDELRNSNVLVLPSRRTLRDYKNAIKPTVGFNSKVIGELCNLSKDFNYLQKFICLAFDEMKIQSNLVYDKYSGELIGYVDLGDPDINYTTFVKDDELATHALVYYVRGIATDLKFCLAYFATNGIKSYQIMSTFWKGVSILELTCQLKVIATVSDGASPNRKFFRIHKFLDPFVEDVKNVTYKTINIFNPDRYIYFFADVPHLIKTGRNCLYHSGSGKCTRYMWNNQKFIIWNHVAKIVYDELENGLKVDTKLSYEHIKLTHYSVMNVRLAAQTLSKTTANILRTYYGEDTTETALFCENIDNFFDALNVRNTYEGDQKRKNFLQPYRSVDDQRFDWLENVFLKYLSDWKKSIEERPGQYTANAKDRMFIAWQTYEGIQISVYSVIEATKYLLGQGMEFVLTERFNQDCVEEYFGRQRSAGNRNDNPSISQFGYNDNTIRIQRSVVPVTGNTKGAHKTKRRVSWRVVDEAPLPKRKKEL